MKVYDAEKGERMLPKIQFYSGVDPPPSYIVYNMNESKTTKLILLDLLLELI